MACAGGETSDPLAAFRLASYSEDPSTRRNARGGKLQFIFAVIPATVPAIASDRTGALLLHMDNTRMTAQSPAAAGEQLLMLATNLGPVAVPKNPDEKFNPAVPVVGPVQITLEDQPADVVHAGGYLGNVYSVYFRVPEVPAGSAKLRLSSGWIEGGTLDVPVK